jgi:transcriptional regulator with XRE-family HTH domain
MNDESRELLLNLAQKLKEQRRKKNLTQEQVLFDTGIHIARIEQGKRDISYTTLCRLADYFGVGLEEFR